MHVIGFGSSAELHSLGRHIDPGRGCHILRLPMAKAKRLVQGNYYCNLCRLALFRDTCGLAKCETFLQLNLG